jgi:Icc-related predicted phosphoesterase|tara:strand:+ start:572 stop:1144 length:573 start_codon:yes stop_codon:yes gene_type:complete
MHGSASALKKIKKNSQNCDIIVCGGDFTIFEQNMGHLLKEFSKLKKEVLMIHGNHEEEGLLRHFCHKYKNIHFIHGTHFIFKDVVFLGWGGGGFSKIDREFEKKGKKFRKFLKDHKDKAFVLITHAPPYKTKLDKIEKNYVGNKSISDFIKDNKVDLSISGHLHENDGKMDKIGKSTVINPGREGKILKI